MNLMMKRKGNIHSKLSLTMQGVRRALRALSGTLRVWRQRCALIVAQIEAGVNRRLSGMLQRLRLRCNR